MSAPQPSFSLLVVADDLGASPGVNGAIGAAYRDGGLTHASVVVNAPYFREALDGVIRPLPELGIGLHLNLTSGRPCAAAEAVPDLVGRDGRFWRGFVSLWRAGSGRARRELSRQVRTETEAQIRRALDHGIRLTHLDGHRHVHMIPWVYRVVKELAEEHGIPRIREVNEELWWTLKTTRDASCLWNPNLLKYFMLKRFRNINAQNGPVYFFSILYSCRLTRRRLRGARPPPPYEAMEIMLHPGRPEVDRTVEEEDAMEKGHRLSRFRQEEFEACLALKHGG